MTADERWGCPPARACDPGVGPWRLRGAARPDRSVARPPAHLHSGRARWQPGGASPRRCRGRGPADPAGGGAGDEGAGATKVEATKNRRRRTEPPHSHTDHGTGSAHAHGPGGEPPRRFDPIFVVLLPLFLAFTPHATSSTDSRLPPTTVLILISKIRQRFVFRCPCSAPRRLWRLDFLSSYDCFKAGRNSSTSRRRYSSGSCSRDRRGRRHS